MSSDITAHTKCHRSKKELLSIYPSVKMACPRKSMCCDRCVFLQKSSSLSFPMSVTQCKQHNKSVMRLMLTLNCMALH